METLRVIVGVCTIITDIAIIIFLVRGWKE